MLARLARAVFHRVGRGVFRFGGREGRRIMQAHGVRAILVFRLVLAAALLAARAAGADDRDARIEELQRQMREMMRLNAEQQKQIEELRNEVRSKKARVPEEAAPRPAEVEKADQRLLDEALQEVGAESRADVPAAPAPTQPAMFSRRFAGAQLRLIDISFNILTAAGWSTEDDDSIRDLQGGAHDPRRRGFTLQQGEFSLAGAVDPYFYGEAHAVFGTDFVELEEAFFQTTSLPWNLQLEGGYFLTEFGRINPVHPHAWRWIDQPIILSRTLGGEGLRAPGVRLGWLTPLPWFSEVHVGVQNGNEGETTLSFLSSEAIGGRPAVRTDTEDLGDLLYLARWDNSWDVTDELTALVGFSGLFGTNSTGDHARTFIYGTDLTFKWQPTNSFRGWPFLEWQTEVVKRDYTAEFFIAGTETGGDPGHGHGHGDGAEEPAEDEFPNNLPGDILRDWGGYSQLLWGFRWPWAAGIRFEYASGRGPSVADGVLVSRSEDPTRDDRWRLSPLLIYRPTEFSRLRLQYNLDHAKHLAGDDAHSFWLGVEVLYGSHAAHKY
jgi:hypothetical protein